jgi:Tfp pilus assembly protein PilE
MNTNTVCPPKRSVPLIELLVVIAIIAILAAICCCQRWPKAKAKAHQIYCLNNGNK